MLTKEKCGALAMLIFAVAYGFQATRMPLTFLAAQETFNSKTLPIGLAIGAGIIALLILILPPISSEARTHVSEAFKDKEWGKTALLFVNMGAYGFVMPILGFVVASFLFLIAGFYILGERRWRRMIFADVLVVAVLWVLLSRVMGIYIAPGEIFYWIGVL